MTRRELDFRRRKRPPAPRGRLLAMAFLLVLAGLALALRPWWSRSLPDGTLVEVVGEVPRPGFHLLEDPTVAEAVSAAGGDAVDLPRAVLRPGDRVVVGPDGVHVAPGGDPLLVAVPVDLNSAGADALRAVPGIGEALAARIVEDRLDNGPFRRVEELVRVPGIGEETLRSIAPFVEVPETAPIPPPGPVDLNTATAAELETLPGIGPVTAARIVVDREERGPYRQVNDLRRVRGIGERTVAGLEDRAIAGKPAD